jgi:glycosyltransferase involved in cell wall biosynthesis
MEHMRRLSVLHVLNSFVDSSISCIVLRLVENLGSRDFSWHVGAVTGLGDMQVAFAKVGCRVIDLAGNGAGSPRRVIRSYVREHSIDIVHTHTARTILDASLAMRGLPCVKHVATKHLLNTPHDRRWGLGYAIWDHLALYLPDLVIPVSNSMRDRITSQPLIDRNKVVLIRNAIPANDFHRPGERVAQRHELGIAADAIVLGYAGRIEKVKRIDLLLEAFTAVRAQLPHARLVIAGEGSLTAQMQGLAGALGISHAVAWLGFHRDMPRLLAAIDVYVQSSVNEGLSLSILEAMAAEKAVVATNVGGASEVIADGETGILVPPGSAAAIAAAVLDLIEDTDRSAKISQAARAHVESEFGIRKMVERYGAVYASLTSGDSSPTTW